MRIIERGSGPALVLIPGIQGRWEYLLPAMAALSRSYRVMAFSLADEPSARDDFDRGRGFDSYVAQVGRALDERGLEQAIVCGVSFGGLIALRFAAECPARVSRLVLVSTPGPSWHLRTRHDFYARWPHVFGVLFLIESPLRMRREVGSALPRWRDRVAFAASQIWTLACAPLSLVRMARRARMIGSTGALDSCARVVAPTLVVTGEPHLDYVVPTTTSADYCSLIRDARGAVLERTGHVGSITRPMEFAAVVRQFIDDADRRRPHRTEVA